MIALALALAAQTGHAYDPRQTPSAVAFTCAAGHRVLDVSREGGTLVYHSWRRGAPEIGLDGGRLARTGYSGGGETQVYFRNGPWTYIVFERSIRTGFGADGHNDEDLQAGVDVMRAGRVVTRVRCDEPDTTFRSAVLRGLPEGAFISH